MANNKLVKRKNAGSKGNAQLKPRKCKQQDQIAFAITDMKETVISENFYQPVPLSTLQFYVPKGML